MHASYVTIFAGMIVTGGGVHAFSNKSPLVVSSSRISTGSTICKNNKNDETEDMLEKARKLREEATFLEEQIKPARQIFQGDESASKPVVYTDLSDSVWQVTFRVRDESSEDDAALQRKLKSVGGNAVIKLKSDGYTEIIENKDFFTKFWGWDEEKDADDKEKDISYLVFSADCSDGLIEAGFDGGTRLYFNSRIDIGSNGDISVNDGKITVKKEVQSGFWGVFNSSGILAQFRVIGDFIMKPL